MSLVFTMPGKLGDALHQWPIAFHYCRVNNVKCTLWLDEKSLNPLVPLFEAQPCVEKVELKSGIENYQCGGQPWHFDFPTSAYEGHTVYHLGYRSFPARQLTLECLEQSKVPLSIDPQELAETCTFETEKRVVSENGCVVLHGQGICPHTRATPQFWKFLATVWDEISEKWNGQLYFAGTSRDREVAESIYARPGTWGIDDGGDFQKLANFVASSNLVIGCGSSIAALAGALKIPCVRVHDPIAEAPKIIWSNLGSNQLNATEIELRTAWPEFRDKLFNRREEAYAEGDQENRGDPSSDRNAAAG